MERSVVLLFRYNGKIVRITDKDGGVFTGTAEVYPSGYGLHEFGRAEDSIRLGSTYVFQSDMAKIEVLSQSDEADGSERPLDALMGELLEGSYWIVDILPEQVPKEAEGQYFAVERYFLQPERIRALRRKYAEILLRMNCYYDMVVSFDSCKSWNRNPEPEDFVQRFVELSGNQFLRAVFPNQGTMIDCEPADTWITVYGPPPEFLKKLQKLAAAEGFFVWQPQSVGE
jgi:hypothetical protein